MPTDITVYDHVRPAEADLSDGVYRVVGTTKGDVSLLRVADADGRRIHSGAVVTVDRDSLESFESAENPDDSRSIGAMLAGVPRSTYWSLRTFALTLAANPLPAAIAGALFLVGSLEEPGISLPDPVSTAFVFAGALGLAYVGSGRF